MMPMQLPSLRAWLFLSDGRIFNEVRRGDLSREEYFGRIMEVVTFLGGEARHVG